MPTTIEGMTAKEKVLELARGWSEEQAAAALHAAESESSPIVVEDQRPAGAAPDIDEERGEPEMLPIPKDWGWGCLPSGRPAPNWVAGLDEVRRGR
jgi:hypothetical protein